MSEIALKTACPLNTTGFEGKSKQSLEEAHCITCQKNRVSAIPEVPPATYDEDLSHEASTSPGQAETSILGAGSPLPRTSIGQQSSATKGRGAATHASVPCSSPQTSVLLLVHHRSTFTSFPPKIVS